MSVLMYKIGILSLTNFTQSSPVFFILGTHMYINCCGTQECIENHFTFSKASLFPLFNKHCPLSDIGNLSRYLFKPFVPFTLKNVLGFPIFRFFAYMMEVLPENWHAH